MKTAIIFLLFLSGCGVKSAPMPRRDEAFIKKTEIESKDKKKADKTTIIPSKDIR